MAIEKLLRMDKRRAMLACAIIALGMQCMLIAIDRTLTGTHGPLPFSREFMLAVILVKNAAIFAGLGFLAWYMNDRAEAEYMRETYCTLPQPQANPDANADEAEWEWIASVDDPFPHRRPVHHDSHHPHHQH